MSGRRSARERVRLEKGRAEPSMRYLSRQTIAHVRSNWDHGAWILIIIASAFERGVARLFTVSAFSSLPSLCLSRSGTRISFRESGTDRGWRDGGARWRSSAAGSSPPGR